MKPEGGAYRLVASEVVRGQLRICQQQAQARELTDECREALLAMVEHLTAQPLEFDKPVVFKGPLLRDVLGRVQAAKMKITVLAIDGYSGWLMPEDVDSSDWILALEADGVPLGIGQQGPIWLINTRGEGQKPSPDHRGDWVWGMFYMRVGE